MKQSIAIFAAAGALSSLAAAQFHRHNHGHGHLHKRDVVYETYIETKTDVVQTTVYVPAGGAQGAPPTPAADVKAADYEAPAEHDSNEPHDTNPDTKPQAPPAQPQAVEKQKSPEQLQQEAIDQQQKLNQQQEQKNQQQVEDNNRHQQNPEQPPSPPSQQQPQAPASSAAPPPPPAPYSPPGGSSGGSDNSGGGGGGASKTAQVSYYSPGDGGQATSCGQKHANSDPGVALGFSIMNTGKAALCGKSISVKVNGQTHSVPIIDSCQACDQKGRIDLTEGSFTQLFGDLKKGVVNNVEWSMPS